jgi:paraquat-inducible protein A
MSASTAIICEHCDTVHRREPLAPRAVAECVRCGCVLYRGSGLDLDAMLALALAGLLMLAVGNAYPIVTLEARGQRTAATLWEAVVLAQETGVGGVALVAATTVFLFPLLQLGLYIWIVLPLRLGQLPPGFVSAMHGLRLIRPWSMVEVFFISVLVSVVKLSGMAAVQVGPGLWGFAALTLLLTALGAFDLRELWPMWDRLRGDPAAEPR